MVSKILVNRIKSVLPFLVSQEQSAYVEDRVIMDNVLVAQEVIHSMGNKSEGKQLMGLKLDMERAYDMKQWEFVGGSCK